ncbi:MAG: type III pantothenate kinase [Bacteroidota bacterium]
MNLVIDVGNTQVKTAVFKKSSLIEKDTFPKEELINYINDILNKYPISNCILSSVGKIKYIDLQKIENLIDLIILNQNTKIPFKNLYKTPKTLGVDRIALVAAAVSKYPNCNVLVIDAGSCITYDFVNRDGEYFGGAISPGIEMRYKALHSYTANLPKLSLTNEVPVNGDSTENSIHIGVINGVIQEIKGTIAQFETKNKKLTVVLTGGNTIFLAKNLKSTIFANPNFLLEGLNSILFYNL